MKEIKWNVGKSGASLDNPPFRAYFYWLEDGQLVQTADYSYSELVEEIKRRTAGGEEKDPFMDALRSLGLSKLGL